ncbi:MAG TPA: DUF5996 family protein [bacterium]|nr:DUF5996 family protein [bacterium]
MTMPDAPRWTDSAAAWPPLPLEAWRDTCDTLHMWTQIVGKVRLTLTRRINHYWHSTFYVTPRGLTTSAIPYGSGTFEMRFDFLAHELVIDVSDGATRRVRLAPRTVADFYKDVMETLDALGISVRIVAIPDEVPNPIPFAEDTQHASYDPEYATRFWRVLASADTVLKAFRGRFMGKCSPVHFFWGSFDLAVSRFSGRRASPPPGTDADFLTREGYSHEVSSVGFWPGSGTVLEPAFYAYTAPAPPGLERAGVQPAGASYDKGLGEFLFPYERMRTAASPRWALLEFAQSSYEAGADLAGWDRAALERPRPSTGWT